MTPRHPADVLSEAQDLLDFLLEALAALAGPAPDTVGLGGPAVGGLHVVCSHLHRLCQEAAENLD